MMCVCFVLVGGVPGGEGADKEGDKKYGGRARTLIRGSVFVMGSGLEEGASSPTRENCGAGELLWGRKARERKKAGCVSLPHGGLCLRPCLSFPKGRSWDLELLEEEES